MDTLACILAIYPTAALYRDFTLVSTNGTVTIDKWLSTTLTQPTQAQLDAAWATVQVQQAQVAQIATIQLSFEAAFTAPVSYSGVQYPMDRDTQQYIAHVQIGVMAKGSLPSGFYVLDVNRNQVALTQTKFNALQEAMMAQGFAAWTNLNTRIAQIQAATTVAAVQAVVW